MTMAAGGLELYLAVARRNRARDEAVFVRGEAREARA